MRSNVIMGGFEMKKILVLFTLLIFPACSPSEIAIQTAISQTQTAMPANINTPEPSATYTFAPTETPTFTPTFEPTPTFTNTPTLTSTPDLRVITIDSKEFLLTKADLPPDAKYHIPNSLWMTPHHNSEVLSGWGRERGLEYLDKTGRIDGWVLYFRRGVDTVKAPAEIMHNIIQYKSCDGALLTVTEFSAVQENQEWNLIEDDFPLGDYSRVYKYRRMENTGKYSIFYRIETVYRNYVSIVQSYGLEIEYDFEYVVKIAETALKKLEMAPLGVW